MALTHRERDPRAAMSRRAVRTWATLLIVVNLGLGVLVFGAVAAATDIPPQGRIILMSIGAFWALAALLLARGWSLRPSKRRLVTTTTIDGRPATVIRMSRHRMVEALCFSGGIVALCVIGSVMALTSEQPALLLLPAPFLLLFLPVALDMILALSRPVGITLTPDGIDVRSWYSRGSLPWDELWTVRLIVDTHGTRLVVRGSGATPRVPKQLFSFWPGQERHRTDTLLIDVDAIEPHGRPLEALLTEIVEAGSPFRRNNPDDITSRMGTPWAEQALQPRQPDERPDGITFH